MLDNILDPDVDEVAEKMQAHIDEFNATGSTTFYSDEENRTISRELILNELAETRDTRNLIAAITQHGPIRFNKTFIKLVEIEYIHILKKRIEEAVSDFYK